PYPSADARAESRKQNAGRGGRLPRQHVGYGRDAAQPRRHARLCDRLGISSWLRKMNRIVERFVRATRWQLYALYTIAYVIFAAAMIATGAAGGSRSKHDWKVLLVVWVCELPVVLGIFGWICSAGLFLNSLLKPALRMRDGFFRFSLGL